MRQRGPGDVNGRIAAQRVTAVFRGRPGRNYLLLFSGAESVVQWSYCARDELREADPAVRQDGQDQEEWGEGQARFYC